MFSSTSKRQMVAAASTLLLGGWVASGALAPDPGPTESSAPSAGCVAGTTAPDLPADERYRRSITPGVLLYWAE